MNDIPPTNLQITMIHLAITRGQDAPFRATFADFPVTIGRDPSCSLRLTDPEVSRFHAHIKKRGKIFVLSDSSSKNGCYINGEKTINSPIASGDRIIIGDTEVLFATTSDDLSFSGNIEQFSILLENKSESTTNEQKNSELRLDDQLSLNSATNTSTYSSKIIDSCSNITIANSLDETVSALLFEMMKLSKSILRTTFFSWDSHTNQLIPQVTHRRNKKDNKLITINQKTYFQVVNRKKGYIRINLDASKDGVSTQIILPVISTNRILGIIHFDLSTKNIKKAHELVEKTQLILSLVSAKIETMILRNELDSTMLGVVEAMVATIEAKDTYTVGHSERVCRYSMAIAGQLQLSSEIKKLLMISALCHDIGKIGIPDQILKKAALLSTEEYEEMKLHPTIGAQIMSNIPNAHRFLSGIKYHHEKWDGTGYPDALAGEEIPFFGRIIAVADTFDAMISGRSYSGFIDESEAIKKIESEQDLFDPEIIRALIKAWESGALTQRTSTVGKS